MMVRKMPLLVIALAILGVLSSNALGLDPMGPPAAGLAKGQFRAGAEYADSRMDVKLNNGSSTHSVYAKENGVWVFQAQSSSSSKAASTKLKNLKMHKVYANLGYGLSDTWEAFLRLGGMNTEFKGTMFPGSDSPVERQYNGDTGFAIGFGTKITFYEEGKLKWGALFQMSWGSSDAKFETVASGNTINESIELNVVEIQIALGAVYEFSEKIKIYGGPFWHIVNFSDSDLGGKRSELYASQADLVIDKTSYDLDDVSNFGGYIGAQVEVAEDTYCNIEYQHTSSSDAIAMHLRKKF